MVDNWDIIVPLNLDSFHLKGKKIVLHGHFKLDDTPAFNRTCTKGELK